MDDASGAESCPKTWKTELAICKTLAITQQQRLRACRKIQAISAERDTSRVSKARLPALSRLARRDTSKLSYLAF